MKNILTLTALLATTLAATLAVREASADVKVVTTDTTLAFIAKEVGGDKVSVESLARATDDPHHVEPTGSMVVKVAHAQVVARIGMDLDIWLDPLLEKAGNSGVMRGGKGYGGMMTKILVSDPGSLPPQTSANA